MALVLKSPAFANGERMPNRYTCEGEDISPPLEWMSPPEGAQSFALTCTDPDAPRGIWHHWAVYDIAADARGLAEAYPTNRPSQAMNDFGRPGYGGPCPPKDHGVHRYRFRLLALDRERLDIGGSPNCEKVYETARRHVIGEAELLAAYSR